jgi:hypothetical protein
MPLRSLKTRLDFVKIEKRMKKRQLQPPVAELPSMVGGLQQLSSLYCGRKF